jgi:hypothetical protein
VRSNSDPPSTLDRAVRVVGGRGQLGEHDRSVTLVVRVGDGALVARPHRTEFRLLDAEGQRESLALDTEHVPDVAGVLLRRLPALGWLPARVPYLISSAAACRAPSSRRSCGSASPETLA